MLFGFVAGAGATRAAVFCTRPAGTEVFSVVVVARVAVIRAAVTGTGVLCSCAATDGVFCNSTKVSGTDVGLT